VILDSKNELHKEISSKQSEDSLLATVKDQVILPCIRTAAWQDPSLGEEEGMAEETWALPMGRDCGNGSVLVKSLCDKQSNRGGKGLLCSELTSGRGNSLVGSSTRGQRKG
jgi:hypothetical protein